MPSNRWTKNALPGALGILLFLLIWELLGRTGVLGLTWPPLTSVIATLIDPSKTALFLRATSASLTSAGTGYLAGGALGLVAALAGHLIPTLQEGLSRFAAVVNSVPPIALASVFLVLVTTESTPTAVAAIKVFFIIFIAVQSGLRSATPAQHDLFTSLGTGRFKRLWLLEVPTMLPVAMSGLKIAVPVALIGAFVGEWFGASRGLGVLILNAMQNFQISMLWSAVLLATLVSLAVYFILTMVESIVRLRLT